jgi:hypothetical protein
LEVGSLTICRFFRPTLGSWAIIRVKPTTSGFNNHSVAFPSNLNFKKIHQFHKENTSKKEKKFFKKKKKKLRIFKSGINGIGPQVHTDPPLVKTQLKPRLYSLFTLR